MKPNFDSWQVEVTDTRCNITNKVNKNKIKYIQQQCSSTGCETMTDREHWDMQSKWDVAQIYPSLLLSVSRPLQREKEHARSWQSPWLEGILVGGQGAETSQGSVTEQRAIQRKISETHMGSPHIFNWGLLSTFLWRIYTTEGKNHQKGSEEIIPRTHRAKKKVCFHWLENLITHRTSGRVIRSFPLAIGQKIRRRLNVALVLPQ